MGNNKWQVQEDLATAYGSANFDHTKVATLAGDPTVQTLDDGLANVAATNGLIQIGDAFFIRFDKINDSTRHVVWHCDVNVFFNGNLTTLREMVGELDRLNNANNVSATRTYLLNFIRINDLDAKSYGRIETTVEIIYEFASVPLT